MTPSDFTAWFPRGQFGASGASPTYIQADGTLGADSTYVQTFIDRAAPRFDVDRWGDDYLEGVANYVAHSIVVDQSEGGQPVNQIDADDGIADSIGPISSRRSEKSVEMTAKDPILRTTYGRRFAFLRGQIGHGGIMVL